uniref:Uncharacterized protein n=1 Tax=Rhabditophanes sp. KR3021 TaxID=114890 RepID=A0AC35U6B4_9BILA
MTEEGVINYEGIRPSPKLQELLIAFKTKMQKMVIAFFTEILPLLEKESTNTISKADVDKLETIQKKFGLMNGNNLIDSNAFDELEENKKIVKSSQVAN